MPRIPENPVVRIEITGEIASGKSTVAHLLQKWLQGSGYDAVRVDDKHHEQMCQDMAPLPKGNGRRVEILSATDSETNDVTKLKEQLEQKELELQVAALLLASARKSYAGDASHLARDEFTLVADRIRNSRAA